jgi:hypothetical protein
VHCLITKDFRQMPIKISKLRVEDGINAQLMEAGCIDTEWTVRTWCKVKVNDFCLRHSNTTKMWLVKQWDFRQTALFSSAYECSAISAGSTPEISAKHSTSSGHCTQSSPHHDKKTYGGAETYLRVFLTSSLGGRDCSAQSLGCIVPAESDNHWIWGWVGPRVGLDAIKTRQISAPVVDPAQIPQ